ncbi:histone deacetylase 14 [Tanacetum coccineum]|uniref:Histone deacetylase 14 n=1 Tax=Tanacetum coccineum TaxID=301880 RepID=A0ABQ4WX74_9ASTR
MITAHVYRCGDSNFKIYSQRISLSKGTKKGVSNVVGDVPSVNVGKEDNIEDGNGGNIGTNNPQTSIKGVSKTQIENVIMEGSSMATRVSFASMVLKPVSENTPVLPKIINFRTLVKEEQVSNHDTVLPKAAKESVMSRYANTLIGYFVGKSLAFQIVQNYVNNTWAKFGLSKLMKMDNGVFLFKFEMKSDMDQVIEQGSWLIRNTPLILSKWAPNVSLKPGEVTKVPIWVKLYNVPVVAYSEDGLSLIATQVGKLIMLDAFTSSMLFGHNSEKCPKKVSVADSTIDTLANDGFTEVVSRKNKGKKVANQMPKNQIAAAKEASKSNPRTVSDLEEESDEDDVYFPNEEYTSGLGGGFSLDEDDLDCYDGYEAQVYDIPEGLHYYFDGYDIRLNSRDNMANENVPAPAPIRSDDQILPFGAWVPIGKSNYARLLEFIQAIQTFLADKANLGISTKKDKKTKPHVIPYCRFTKLIICYLGRKHNINQRSESSFNMAEDDHHLGNLKFIPKGEEDEHDQKITAEEGGKKKSTSKLDQSKKPVTAKQPKPVSSKQSKPAPAKQPKPVKEKSTKPSHVKKAAKGKVRKVRKGKSSLQLVDKPDEEEPQPAPKPQVEDEEFDLQQGIPMSLEYFQAHGQAPVGRVAFHEPASGITKKLPIVEGKGKGIATDEHVAQSLLELQMPKKTSTMDQYIFQRWISVTEEASTRPSAQPEDDTSANIVRDTLSPTYAKTGAEIDKTNSEGDIEILNIGEKQGEDVATKVGLEEKTTEIDEGQAGSDLDPDPMHDDFVVTVYPQVHESLKHPDVEHYVLTLRRDKLQDKTVQGLSSKVFTLELWDLPYKIDQTVNKAVKEAVQIALQAPLKERFRDLFEDNVKEILHDGMFESGSYRSQLEHVALYEALEASMERDNRDEFLTEKDKSLERCRHDQDPLAPPTKESEQNKKKKQDSDASGSKQTSA